MVQFLDLMNKHEDRKVRDIVEYKGEFIRVFEPSKLDIDKIIDMQSDFVKTYNDETDKEKKELDISGQQLVRDFFPMLTDIEGMEDLTDEELNEVVENPSVKLLMVSHIIEGIVTDVYKMTILSARNRILEADFKMEDARMASEMLAKIMGMAEQQPQQQKVINKVKNSQMALKKAKEKEKEAELESLISEANDKAQENSNTLSSETISSHEAILSQFKKSFND